ncbi:MAG: isomerase/hydrolase [Alcanivorax sp.]|nr:isomerase/hydrolase [Alcanivorax sp.]MAY10262.1 isomerase/hydrolase [Alcanivorax sp.]MBI53776.1 isomerase/hydrolase [Alcanivorax sp.]MBU59126.1 isomerase/hydrolase [Alcanivorax sp.]HCE39954.1 fumarylacetoacetate hydrolase family protein [Alcanivorax sp.]|tara:strand:+ start:63849 stop:64538 length:690 start_codon:yes stop_codon:yes gene_type:complete
MSEAYLHRWIDGSAMDRPVGKIVCVGRNYADHARELGNEVPSQPLLFMKGANALCSLHEPLVLPEGQGEVHHEVEMVVMIGKRLRGETDLETIRYSIAAYGIGLDLTLRDVQARLKEKGQPWERAKAFDGAAPVSGFVDARGISVRQNLEVSLEINGETRQHGHTGQMLFPTFELLADINRVFTLEPGDLVFTGTPAGVGPLMGGDTFTARLGNILQVFGRVQDAPSQT